MKTHLKHWKVCAILLSLLIAVPQIQAQDNGAYFTINGVVKNKSSKKKLESVIVSVPGSSVSTVTNADGEFTLKISNSSAAKQIEFTLVGFFNLTVPINHDNVQGESYFMEPKSIQLKEVVVVGWETPERLIEQAIRKIPENYSSMPNLLTGFYRETAQKKKNYINVAEAVINIYKTSYNEDTDRDKVQILKGRKLLSAKKSDTLAVKLLGGPNLSIFVDVVKNPDFLLNLESIHYFKYKMIDPVMIDNRLHYVVEFEPQVTLPYPLYFGKYFIDSQSLAFSRVEMSMDMRDRVKATDMILRKKPSGLRFKPEEVSFVITYKQRNNKTYLNYIRNEVHFKCDWSRRLFATNYTVTSEMVVTNDQLQNVVEIPWKNSFRGDQSLSDKVSDFSDDNFWGAYNIIEPTESLESAVGKLKKTYK